MKTEKILCVEYTPKEFIEKLGLKGEFDVVDCIYPSMKELRADKTIDEDKIIKVVVKVIVEEE